MPVNSYFPGAVFTNSNEAPVHVFAAPQRYIQGPGVIDRIGGFLSAFNFRRAGILASKRGLGAEGARVADSLRGEGIESVTAEFGGECSTEEIETHAAALAGDKPECLIAVGGGKPIDAGKCIAYRLDIPVVIVPTLASNDAPCSALSVVYTPAGVSDRVEFFPQSPLMVVCDSRVVADASERFLVAGMGDAMATWYEARICSANPEARTPLGGRPTLAACALGRVCAETLYEYGEAAARSVLAGRTDEALEKVIEANTLLSGIGFESGGLALAHPMALACTEIDAVHDNHLHGEMVAMGTLTQLVLEGTEEAETVARFFARVGLPVHLGQLSMDVNDLPSRDRIIEKTLANPNAHYMPVPIDHDVLRQAMLDTDELGRKVAGEQGDEAWRRLQA